MRLEKELDDESLMFIKRYGQNSNLLGRQLWVNLFTYQTTTKPLHFRLKKNTCFNATVYIEGRRAIVVPSTDWELSPCVVTQWPNVRRNRAMRGIQNHF